MNSPASIGPRRTLAVIGLLLLFCALLFYYFAVLRIDFRNTALLNFNPHPDADEYFGQARSIVDGAGPYIQIGYDKLPSRYPAGYPVLVALWMKRVQPTDGILAPFRTNQSVGLLLLLGLFAFYACRHRPFEGGVATLLLATLPGFVSYSRSSMSDLSGSAVAMVSFFLLAFGLVDRKRWLIYAAAVVLGLGVNIRMQVVFFAPMLLAITLFPVPVSRSRWFLDCAGVLFVFLLATSPLFILNTREFGGPLKTGYDFWVPTLTDKHWVFSLRNVPRQAELLVREVTATRKDYQVGNIFGTGACIVPPFVILTLIGFILRQMDRFELCALLGAGTFFVSAFTYRFVDGRFYLPLIFLAVPLATFAVGWAVRMATLKRHWIGVVVILALMVLTVAGYPSQSGFRPQGSRSQLWDAIEFTPPVHSSAIFEAEQTLLSRCGDKPGIVLSDLDPVCLNAMLPRPFVAAPIDGKHHYDKTWKYRYGKTEALALTKRALTTTQPVYGLFLSAKDFDNNAVRLPHPEDRQWVTVANVENKAVIVQLVPLPQA